MNKSWHNFNVDSIHDVPIKVPIKDIWPPQGVSHCSCSTEEAPQSRQALLCRACCKQASFDRCEVPLVQGLQQLQNPHSAFHSRKPDLSFKPNGRKPVGRTNKLYRGCCKQAFFSCCHVSSSEKWFPQPHWYVQLANTRKPTTSGHHWSCSMEEIYNLDRLYFAGHVVNKYSVLKFLLKNKDSQQISWHAHLGLLQAN